MLSSLERLRGWEFLQLHAPILQYELRDLEGDIDAEMQEHRYGQNVKLAGLESSAVPGRVEPGFSGKVGQCQNASGRMHGADLNAEVGTRCPFLRHLGPGERCEDSRSGQTVDDHLLASLLACFPHT